MSIPTHQEAEMQKTAPRQHPAVVLRSQYRQLKSLLVVLTVALVSLSVTVVALVTDDVGTQETTGYFHPFNGVNQPERTGGPDESNVAAAISAQPQPQPETARPDESKIAAAIGKRVQLERDTSRPDESKIAASIGKSGGFHVFTGRPDEAKVAASISPSIHHN
jgi:hypothetical protein